MRAKTLSSLSCDNLQRLPGCLVSPEDQRVRPVYGTFSGKSQELMCENSFRGVLKLKQTNKKNIC